MKEQYEKAMVNQARYLSKTSGELLASETGSERLRRLWRHCQKRMRTALGAGSNVCPTMRCIHTSIRIRLT
ncbi:MAG: hypothetical protein ACLVJO_04490 [[Clostridium] scindens]